MGSIELPKITLHTVTHHGIAHFARHDNAQLTSCLFPPDHMADEMPAHQFLTVRENGTVLRTPMKTLGVRKLALARQNRLTTSDCFYNTPA